MTEEQIMEGEILLSDFIGIIIYWTKVGSEDKLMTNVKAKEPVYLTNWSKTQFSESFDWLVPVIRKFCCMQFKYREIEQTHAILVMTIDSAVTLDYNVLYAFGYVVKAVKWYNDLTEKQKQLQ